jgi:hypothetical protein
MGPVKFVPSIRRMGAIANMYGLNIEVAITG